jgi:uncharacterized YigZ family protein
MFKTVCAPVKVEITEKRSRFIAFLFPVQNALEAQRLIRETKAKYRDAKHHCFAYVIRENHCTKFSDDGEPQGTAGQPILDCLLKNGLTNCLCIVTRYFGGVLLGAGGLVRAYSSAAAKAVANCEISEMVSAFHCVFITDFSKYNTVLSVLEKYNCFITQTIFLNKVKIYFNAQADYYARLNQKLLELTNGEQTIKIEGECYIKNN